MNSVSTSHPRRIGIVGAGAVGGHVAARLALAGHQVTLLARGATLEAVRAHGLRYATGGQASQRVEVRAEATPQAMGAQDLVILALKSQALPTVVPTLGPMLAADTPVLTLNNGLPWWYFLVPGQALEGQRLARVDPLGETERAVDISRVLGGTIMTSCHCPEPGVVVHSAGARLALGEPGGGLSERAALWSGVLADAGLGAVASPQIRVDIWLKLLGNICANPLSLLTGVTTDRMIDDPGVRSLFAAMMEECIALGRRLGLTLDTTTEQRMAQTRQLGAIRSSMLQDLEAGRSVELDAILGAPIECAQAVGQPVPRLQEVFALACLRAEGAGLYP
ncbi:ketopantoate reductase family protein [Hydrogenophaga sp. BPS33]|uniref:ketopantoate reductase family protein n=1 Tax=Hydrogenophaga sp. BPS33 TaxID=2651974 RepID=UPI00131FA622|nr:2-dehydropantoate 2-reductase [Hydrogenophaga sp. BPS33]QHE86532.1 2-dehydropantoate 2-reductase [Hydrogenophaga sp. BPS33]